MRRALLSLVLVAAIVGAVYVAFAQSGGSGGSSEEKQYPTPCIPVLGISSAVDVGTIDDPSVKVPNSGQIYFEQTGILEMGGAKAVPYPEYRACVIDIGPQRFDTDVRYFVEGWAVDSNLGWVSFSCKNGTQIKGSRCSGNKIDYRTEITQGGVVKGFAYADAAGWISWSCEGGLASMLGKDFKCGTVDYQTRVDVKAQPTQEEFTDIFGKYYYPLYANKGVSSFAWSDNLGWFDMMGVKIPFNDFPEPDLPECKDGKDNDGDGKADYRHLAPDLDGDGRPDPDPGCKSAEDDDEKDTQCNDGLDNDGDGKRDFGSPWKNGRNDPGCSSFDDDDESNDPEPSYDCSDGVDNDEDTKVDYPEDPGCSSPQDDSEIDYECSNDFDDDGDGLIDYDGHDGKGPDPGCESPDDDDETNIFPTECNDKKDNDGDGTADHLGVDLNGDGDFDDVVDGKKEYPPDPHCVSTVDQKEDPKCDPTEDPECELLVPQCQDGINNDPTEDNWIDYPDDPGCKNLDDDSESPNPEPSFDCSDNDDNDDDDKIDYGPGFDNDKGCYAPHDPSEIDVGECSDGDDNDGDGLVDYEDPDCCTPEEGEAVGASECIIEKSPQCSDGKDNDGDNLIDYAGKTVVIDGVSYKYAADPDCKGDPKLNDESGCPDPSKVNMAKNYQHCVDIQEYGSWLSIIPDPLTEPVVADGLSGYNIILHLAEGDKIYDESYEYQPTLSLENFMDFELRYKQYSASGASQALTFAELVNAGYVTDFTFIDKVPDGAGGFIDVNSWIAYVQSPVPTNFEEGKNFIITPKALAGQDLPVNNLGLKKIVLNKIKAKNSDVLEKGSCDLQGPGCGISPDENPGSDLTPLNFNPLVKVTELLADEKKYINAVAGVENVIKATVEYFAEDSTVTSANGAQTVDVNLLLSPYDDVFFSPDGTYLYDWKPYLDGAINNNQNATSGQSSKISFSMDLDASAKRIFDNILAVPYLDPNIESPGANGDLTRPNIFSYIEYQLLDPSGVARTINYIWESLPSTEVEGIFNPAADITGLVYSKVVIDPKEPDKVLSKGNLTTNKFMAILNKNISDLNGNSPISQSSGMKINATKGASSCLLSGVSTTLNFEVAGGTYYYVNGADVVFDGNDDINCDGSEPVNNIVVVKGGNVYIDTNLYGGEGKWSIIALGEGVSEQTYFNGGNIYVKNTVTDVHSNMVAQGSVFSYAGSKDSADFEQDGRPKKDTVDEEDLKRQIAFIGSIASKNTFGGCLDQNSGLDPSEWRIPAASYNAGYKYVAGSGAYTNDQDLACLYDLNHFRKFKLYLERYNGMPVDQQCADPAVGIGEEEQFAANPAKGQTITGANGNTCEYNIDTLNSVAAGGDLIDHDGDGESFRAKSAPESSTAPVYIEYSPANPANPVFKQNKSLEVSAGRS